MSFESEVNFCLNYLKATDSKNPSVFSPASISNALAMVYAGANGKTADEIANVLGQNKSREEIIEYYSNFMKKIKSMDDYAASDTWREFEGLPKVIVANQLFISRLIEPLDSFKKEMNEKFDGAFKQVNFADDSAMKDINNFVKDATKGKIETFVDSDTLTPAPSIMLVNVIYFIANWSDRFKPRHEAMFHSNPPRKMNMMTGNFFHIKYAEDKNWKAVQLPYKGERVFMFVVLPKKKDGLEALIQSFDYSMFMKCAKGSFICNKIDVTIPVFKISAKYDLEDTLKNIGISEMFQDWADLTKMFDQGHAIDQAIHSATISVDEYGTEASAATNFGAVPRSAAHPKKFIANHPFLYFIVSMEQIEKTGENSEDFARPEYIPNQILFAGVYC